MPGAAWKPFVAVSVLLSAALQADDAPTSPSAGVVEDLRSINELLDELDAASRWHLSPDSAQNGFRSDAADSYYDFYGFDFQDNSSLGRLKRLRSLSLLTLGELGDAQLFLGVNEHGLLGVHFNAFPRADDESLLEVARMPYLQDDETPDEDGL